MKTILKSWVILILFLMFQPHAFGQCGVGAGCGNGWVFSGYSATGSPNSFLPAPVLMSTPPIPASVFLQFTQTQGDQFGFFSGFSIQSSFPNDFVLNVNNVLGLQSCGSGQSVPASVCYLTLQFYASQPGEETATLVFTGSGNSISVPVVGNPAHTNVAGKWVLFSASGDPSSIGHSCFDQSNASCYEAYLDLNQNSNNLTAPADPLNPGNFLAIDNANCGGGTPAISGSVSGATIGLSIAENILYGAMGGTFGFTGNYSANQPYTGFNLSGSQAPFSGTGNEITGSNSGSTGCPSQDAGIGFEAWQYPSLATSSVVLSVVSQPGVLNLPVTIDISLTENTDFSVSATGTVTGPSCGPLAFTSVDGQAIGNLYGIDFDYTTPTGATGTGSIGLSLITPFVVSQSALQAAGYQASGPGYALQVWSYDISASSDGLCASDPATGFGVAYPKHEKYPRHHRKEGTKKFDWEKLRKKYQQARTQD